MVRQKKADQKEKPKEGTLTIDLASFVRTRDTFVTGLATLQDAIASVSNAYIKHTNAVIGEHGSGFDIDSALLKISENPILGNLNALAAASGAAAAAASVPAVAPAEPAASDKKERKKRQHDPLAPKRPLTPFFLYMQTARPIIAKDLGEKVAKGDVSTEGTKRWTEMAPSAKALWSEAYKDNLRLYNARVAAYRAGIKTARDMTDEEAQAYADSNDIGHDTANAQLAVEAAATEQVEEEEEDAEGEAEPEPEAEEEEEPEPEPEVEKSPTPAPKTPKAKGGRKSKGKATPAEEAPDSASIVPPAKESTPGKKRKRATKKDAEEPAAVEEEAVVETPKSAPKRKKKTKGAA
ncbi:high mobility group protein [Rutstroemia sp. NJR-2017a BBW]|nr:high mobility group protein [Rutstroemia sp. NJR-2017a BBW]